MSPKLPVVSGEDLIRVLKKLGYEVIRQKGSHVRLYPPAESNRKPTTVPLHDEIAKKTLKQIMRDADLPVESSSNCFEPSGFVQLTGSLPQFQTGFES